MKKILSFVLLVIIGFISISRFAVAEDNSYKYLSKGIIQKLDKKIDSIEGDKIKSLILLIGKVNKKIKDETKITNKNIFTEFNTYLKSNLDKYYKLKKKENEGNLSKDLGYSFEIEINNNQYTDLNYILYLLKNGEKIKIDSGGNISGVTFLGNLMIYDWGLAGMSGIKIYDINLMKEVKSVPFGKITKDKKYIYSCQESGYFGSLQILDLLNLEINNLYEKLDLEKNNLLISKCSEPINNIIEFQLANSFDNPTTVLNYTYNFETKKILKTEEKTDNGIKDLFSQEQIKNILTNIDKGIAIQKEKEENNSNTLIQGDFKAEYIAPKDYTKDTDKIIVTVSGKKYELAGVYGEKERQKYSDLIKKGYCRPEGEIVEPSSGDCMGALKFNNFVSFSPSGYYILYDVYGYELSKTRLVNIETGKIYLDIDGHNISNIWTKDKKQFIYGTYDGPSSAGGLFITIKGDFPNTKKINDYSIVGLYADESYIYTTILVSNSVTSYSYNKLLVYNIETLKLVYSQDVDRKD